MIKSKLIEYWRKLDNLVFAVLKFFNIFADYN